MSVRDGKVTTPNEAQEEMSSRQNRHGTQVKIPTARTNNFRKSHNEAVEGVCRPWEDRGSPPLPSPGASQPTAQSPISSITDPRRLSPEER